MRRGTPRAVALVMTAALMCPGTYSLTAFAAEAEADEGELIFAQCEEDSFINIHDKASKKSEITAKIYNNGSAVVEKVAGKKNNWYKISSGNAEGYVKAKYFATGEEAEAIAEEVAYRELTVRPSSLNVHADTNDDSEILDTVEQDGKLEMLAYAGDWLEVALADGESGYVEAQYVDLTTYYPTAETLEEEAARLAAEAQTESEEEEEKSEPETQPEETEEAAPLTGETAEAAEAQSFDSEAESEEIPSYVSEEVFVEEEIAEDVEEEPEETAYVDEEPEEEVIEEEPEEEVYEEEVYEEEVYEEEVYEEEVYEEPVNSATGQEIADYACSFIGNPYVWGGTSLTNGADCSGFVQSVFAHFGISLARTADAQAGCGTAVSLSEIQPGDLLFYCISTDNADDADDDEDDEDGDEIVSTGYISHVGIYIGGGTIVHAANSRRGITTDSAYFATPAAAVRCW